MRRRAALLLLAALAAAANGGCGSGASGGRSGRIRVVAAESPWGSVAAQLGGERAQVSSVITSPAADPHSYEPTAADARRLVSARLAIVNGIGYDPWASRLLAANPQSGRTVLDVGDLLGLRSGENPHQWYSPASLERVIGQITADLQRADPANASYYAARRASFESGALGRYRGLITRIRSRYAGVPVGASESVFAPMARALGLALLTPTGLLKAVSEGTDPTAADKAAADRQLAQKMIRLWIFNSQNSTPDVARLTSMARAAGIPVTTVTETLTPQSATFQAWQSDQLTQIAHALARATGR